VKVRDIRRLQVLAGVMLVLALFGIALVSRGGDGPKVDPPISQAAINHIAQKNAAASRQAAANVRRRAGLPPSPRLAAANTQ